MPWRRTSGGHGARTEPSSGPLVAQDLDIGDPGVVVDRGVQVVVAAA
jgi:hypothetical protein